MRDMSLIALLYKHITAFTLLLAAGLAGILYVIRGIWRRQTGRDGQFVTLYTAQHTAILPRQDESSGPALSLAQLMKDRVPALGPNSKFNGVWWLPGYGVALSSSSHQCSHWTMPPSYVMSS